MGIAQSEYTRLAGLQGAITIIGAALTYFVVTPLAAKSVVYGSCVAVVGTLLLAWRFRQGESRENPGVDWYLRQAYRTAIERFVWVASMLAVGFGLLKLAPLWVLAGFVVGQAAWLIAPVWMKLRTQNDK